MNKYVSTLAFEKKSIEEIVNIAKENNFSVEFSSGLEYRSDMEYLFNQAKINKILHNYFPAPKIPFVLNLASANSEILEKSIEHCLNSIDISAKNNCPFFAAHAGFCIDPSPSELGNQLKLENSFNIEVNWEIFINSLKIIINHSKSKKIQFLIENNVLSKFNYKNYENPLFCCESEQIIKLFEQFQCGDDFGLLLDTAHLKVSCNTLNKNLNEEFEKIKPFIKALHHSDNNGIIDNNMPIEKEYWFLPLLKNFNKIPHVLETKSNSISSINYQLELLNIYGS